MADLTKLIIGELALLQGNEAIARGALEAGLSLAAAYPGNPSSEILETLADSAASAGIYAEWSANEKVALEVAAAASFTGLRAMASMKQNGVNVVQDFICNLTISGTRGGLLLVACDDPSGISSTNEEDCALHRPPGRFAALGAGHAGRVPGHDQVRLRAKRGHRQPGGAALLEPAEPHPRRGHPR